MNQKDLAEVLFPLKTLEDAVKYRVMHYFRGRVIGEVRRILYRELGENFRKEVETLRSDMEGYLTEYAQIKLKQETKRFEDMARSLSKRVREIEKRGGNE